jgi:hypothetical protein
MMTSFCFKLLGRDIHDTQQALLLNLVDNLTADSMIITLNSEFSQRKRPSERFQVQAIGYANPIRPYALQGWIGRDPYFFPEVSSL